MPAEFPSQKESYFAMNLSLGVGVLMLILKMGAYIYTGSAAILSDAAESVVHIVAVAFAAYSLRLSYKPADENHPYGHAKISFFSAGFEGGMIGVAAFYIIYASVMKFISGSPVENVGFGLTLTLAASVINGGLGGYLVWIGKKRRSLILEANGHHVLTDCWTSGGVVIALILTYFTKATFWDPVCGLLMGINILFTGFRLIRTSSSGLMDQVEPEMLDQVKSALDDATVKYGVAYHGLRIRPLGDRISIELHVLLPGDCPLSSAHDTVSEIEDIVRSRIEPTPHIVTHMEPEHANVEEHDAR